jgi:hypothetical protein
MSRHFAEELLEGADVAIDVRGFMRAGEEEELVAELHPLSHRVGHGAGRVPDPNRCRPNRPYAVPRGDSPQQERRRTEGAG